MSIVLKPPIFHCLWTLQRVRTDVICIFAFSFNVLNLCSRTMTVLENSTTKIIRIFSTERNNFNNKL